MNMFKIVNALNKDCVFRPGSGVFVSRRNLHYDETYISVYLTTLFIHELASGSHVFWELYNILPSFSIYARGSEEFEHLLHGPGFKFYDQDFMGFLVYVRLN